MSYLKSNDLFSKLAPETLFEWVPRPILIADHLLTPDNMGALIRLADNIGANEVCFWLITSGLTRFVFWVGKKSIVLAKFAVLQPPVATIFVGISVRRAICTKSFLKARPSSPSRPPTMPLVFMTHSFLRIWLLSLVAGPTRSLNVSHAAAVALFEWQRQMRER